MQVKPMALLPKFRGVMTAIGQRDETRIGVECSRFFRTIRPKDAAIGLAVVDDCMHSVSTLDHMLILISSNRQSLSPEK